MPTLPLPRCVRAAADVLTRKAVDFIRESEDDERWAGSGPGHLAGTGGTHEPCMAGCSSSEGSDSDRFPYPSRGEIHYPHSTPCHAPRRPFFLYLTPYACHRPHLPAPRHIGTFKGLKVPRVPSYNESDEHIAKKVGGRGGLSAWVIFIEHLGWSISSLGGGGGQVACVLPREREALQAARCETWARWVHRAGAGAQTGCGLLSVSSRSEAWQVVDKQHAVP